MTTLSSKLNAVPNPSEKRLTTVEEGLRDANQTMKAVIIILLVMVATIVVMIQIALYQQYSDRINYDTLLIQTQLNTKR